MTFRRQNYMTSFVCKKIVTSQFSGLITLCVEIVWGKLIHMTRDRSHMSSENKTWARAGSNNRDI